jgi:hypothetical protein
VVPIVFRGNQNFRAGDRCPYRTAPKALNLMADWCRPTVRHEPIENRGASITDHTAARIKKENRKILPGILCLLICLLIGGPPVKIVHREFKNLSRLPRVALDAGRAGQSDLRTAAHRDVVKLFKSYSASFPCRRGEEKEQGFIVCRASRRVNKYAVKVPEVAAACIRAL